MTGSWEYVSSDSYDSVVEWYGKRLGGREDLLGENVQADNATWAYEPSRYDNGILIVVTRLGQGARIEATTYVK